MEITDGEYSSRSTGDSLKPASFLDQSDFADHGGHSDGTIFRLGLVAWGCAAVQIATTMIFREQSWSMPIGLACIIFVCAAITFRDSLEYRSDKWRLRLITLSFITWALGFVSIAFQENFFGGQERLSSLCSIAHQFFFVAALIPSSTNEGFRIFRVLDAALSLTFTLLLGLLTWRPTLDLSSHGPDERLIFAGYAALAVLSILAYYSQDLKSDRSLAKSLIVLTVIYALTSELSIFLNDTYRIADNSIIWVIGDLPFIVFVNIARHYGKNHVAYEDLSVFKNVFRKHLSLAFITVLLLFLALVTSKVSFGVAVAAGLFGIAIYVIRMTTLLDHYLSISSRIVVAEQSHSKLLIDMIHEIRAPLASIVLNASMLQRSSDLEGKQAKWVRQIGEGGTRVTRILNDVLEIERIDAGLVFADVTITNLTKVIQGSIAVVSTQAADAQIGFEVVVDHRLNALADGVLLDRVLINLLNNAVRFTPSSGTITITADRDPRDKVVIRIADTGVGISGDRQSALFTRFGSLSAPLRGPRGSGLGLSICHGLMAAMGGEIAIQSELRKGTTIILKLRRGD